MGVLLYSGPAEVPGKSSKAKSGKANYNNLIKNNNGMNIESKEGELMAIRKFCYQSNEEKKHILSPPQIKNVQKRLRQAPL